MLSNILKTIDHVSMKNGSLFSDKAFKYDTVFYIARMILEKASSNKLVLTELAKEQIVDSVIEFFSLPKESDASNNNYLTESLNFFIYSNVMRKDDSQNYTILDMFSLEFISSCIENAYIFMYLVAWKTFQNDNIWNEYCIYIENTSTSDREACINAIKAKYVSLYGDSAWIPFRVKYALMVLGLANASFKVARTLNESKNYIQPIDLSANIAGTKTAANVVKNNFYVSDFRLTYVKTVLAPYLVNANKETLIDKEEPEKKNSACKKAENLLLYGVPGCGKSYTIKTQYCNDDSLMERVVFHPDYSNTDFVGQILPHCYDSGRIEYEFTPGPFTRILRKAVNDAAHHYYLIIEEINRGNAAAIFGDVFQLLDRDNNGDSEFKITNENVAAEVYGDPEQKVSLPCNLSILATMNTSDQNVFTLDNAFKRRWKMRMIENNIDGCELANESVCGLPISWSSFANTINEIIVEINVGSMSNEDRRLGAYFVNKEELSDFDIFGEKVLMYLWNDAVKYDRERVFKSTFRTLDELLVEFKASGLGVFSDSINFNEDLSQQ